MRWQELRRFGRYAVGVGDGAVADAIVPGDPATWRTPSRELAMLRRYVGTDVSELVKVGDEHAVRVVRGRYTEGRPKAAFCSWRVVREGTATDWQAITPIARVSKDFADNGKGRRSTEATASWPVGAGIGDRH